MDNLQGSDLVAMQQWKDAEGHVLGVMMRERVTLLAGEARARYFTTRLLIFRFAVDMEAEVPAEIEVASMLDGRMASLVQRCSICGRMREWHPSPEVAAVLADMYQAE